MEPTRGALARLFEAREPSSGGFQPLLEVRDVRPLGNQERFCVVLSDGEFTSKAVIGKGGPIFDQVAEGRVQLYCLLRLTEWQLVSIPAKKEGKPATEILTIVDAELLGFVPPERRVPAEHLRKFVGASGERIGMTQAIQATPMPSNQQQYTTPEKRVGAPDLSDRTPLNVAQPQQPNLSGVAQASEQCPAYGLTAAPSGPSNSIAAPATSPAWAAMGSESLADAPTQAGALPPSHNPYSAPPAFASASVSSPGAGGLSGQAFGFMSLPGAPLQGGVGRSASASAASATSVPSIASAASAAPASSAAPSLSRFGFQARQQQQLPPGFGGAAGLSGGSGGGSAAAATNIIPIAGLSPYTNGRWKIKARVTLKSDVRKFNNARGEGQLFKVDLVDKEGGEISATFWGKAVDNFYEMLQTQRVYYFSRGSVKMANKRFDKGEHVITFDENTQIEAAEEDRDIPGVQYVFVPLANVDGIDVNVNVDVKAVIAEVREATTVIRRKDDKELVKRELVLWDESGPEGSAFVELTVWGQNAHDNFELGMVIYSKGVRVSEWNGAKSLSGSSGYELNPDCPQAFALRQKYEEKKPQQAANPARASKLHSGTRVSIEECQEADAQLAVAVPGQPFDPNNRTVNRHFMLATLTNIPTDRPPYYPACPELVERAPPAMGNQAVPPEAQKRACNRKVTQNGDIWSCQSGHVCQRPTMRYLGNRVQVVDHTGALETSFFDEGGRQIFGCDANELAALWEDPTRDAELQQRLSKLSWKKYVFRLTSKKENWQDEQRMRHNVEEGSTPNFAKEGHRMLADVKAALQAPSDGMS